ncbi:hypothetical protein PN451_06880 [Dolichospermum planctonicum CS-1226]|uniref:Uncharacterized protein n=1 Tax=Dolichospermum planctonicum CS-1226 TaxID=3021751 RepID=A0ABT5AE69_9CYAN|nr:hypothetical protein [Dolichospermum planctonicum]MDB9535570.1 hypothetical protein [Dolichospermum planctonicum CS-1226]
MCGQDARTTRVLLLISVLHKRITAVSIGGVGKDSFLTTTDNLLFFGNLSGKILE